MPDHYDPFPNGTQSIMNRDFGDAPDKSKMLTIPGGDLSVLESDKCFQNPTGCGGYGWFGNQPSENKDAWTDNKLKEGFDFDKHQILLDLPKNEKDTSCEGLCKERNDAHKKACTALRKRIAQWLDDNACPSIVKAKVPGAASRRSSKMAKSRKKRSTCPGGGCSRRKR